MRHNRWQRMMWLMTAMIVMFVAGCGKKEEKPPSRWEGAQEKTQQQAATVKQAVAGGEFNKFFPQPGAGFKLTYLQEKKGFAEAKLEDQAGKELATFAIFDTLSNPDAAEKYKSSAATLQGLPMVTVGDMGTAILVANRFQAQVRSKDAAFDAAAREEWLKKFDVNGLAKLATP